MSLFLVSAKKENTKDLKLGINRPSVSKKETIDENVKIESSIAKEETSTVKEVTTAEEKNNIAEFKKDIISNGVYINLFSQICKWKILIYEIKIVIIK